MFEIRLLVFDLERRALDFARRCPRSPKCRRGNGTLVFNVLIYARAGTRAAVAILASDRHAQAFHGAVKRRCRARIHGARYLLRFG